MDNLSFLIGAYGISGLVLGAYWLYLVFNRSPATSKPRSHPDGDDPQNG